ncbi:MAG: prepilin-type N-terminal cleavage/methylation domain-containing protein [Planctomycetes bacterium]|nr:prepilin-type N-terminal cleavage/methylation domain-containing protein [Planctomycetota bacterium]
MGPRTRTRTAGFTLIELLAVLVILAILMVVLIPRLAGFGERAKESTTKAWLSQLSAAIGEYEDRFGDYPPSHFLEAWGTPPNTTNLGAEALVLSMWSTEWTGTSLPEDKFTNTDGDEAKRSLSRIPKAALLELADEWGNPIAYFHRRDYGRQDVYVTRPADADAEAQGVARAAKNSVTGRWHNHDRFQLLSAGSDGVFGTEDDLGNFEGGEGGG